MDKAALYLRSSKDRADVSISSQRRELHQLAASRQITIIDEFSDVVESAKTEHRPGFQALLRAIKAPRRTWNVLLAVDTSRLSRRRYIAQVFAHECRKHGVKVIYSKVPEVDPISQVILDSVLQAMDEVHSLMSREKGLAGMRENVLAGYRAGGRAPWGYKLKTLHTGKLREGQPVLKSVLEPDPACAHLAERYLKARAAGTPRTDAARALGITRADTSLIATEWQALTYAGHTVWNVHQEQIDGRYKGGVKRRPRNEWVIARDTHPALIGHGEAEAILAQLETSAHRQAGLTAARSAYVLAGLLTAPNGAKWVGSSARSTTGERLAYYRIVKTADQPGAALRCEEVDKAVIGRIFRDLRSPQFVRALLKEIRKYSEGPEDPAADLRANFASLTQRISTMMDVAADLKDSGPALRKIDALEEERKALAMEIERLESEYSAAAAFATLTEKDVSRWLESMAESVDHESPEALQTMVRSMVEKIDLDPQTVECRIHYALSSASEFCSRLASPRGFAAPTKFRALSMLRIAGAA